MGLAQLGWIFDASPVPRPEDVMDKLFEVSELTLNMKGEGDNLNVIVEELDSELFHWEASDSSLIVCTFMKPNRYLMAQLDQAAALLGGRPIKEVNPRLLVPWSQLTREEQVTFMDRPNWLVRLFTRFL